MTIIILDTEIINDPDTDLPPNRTVEMKITDGQGNAFRHWAGGLPLEGDLQPILDAIEPELLAEAQIKNILFDVFDVKERRILKAVALVIMDELNILRGQHGLPLRNESQIRGAIEAKLQTL